METLLVAALRLSQRFDWIQSRIPIPPTTRRYKGSFPTFLASDAKTSSLNSGRQTLDFTPTGMRVVHRLGPTTMLRDRCGTPFSWYAPRTVRTKLPYGAPMISSGVTAVLSSSTFVGQNPCTKSGWLMIVEGIVSADRPLPLFYS